MVQLLLVFLFLAAPVWDLWRLDVINGRIYLFGRSLPWGQGHQFLLFALAIAFGVLFLNLVVGRFFCSWACPQNSASELAGWMTSSRYAVLSVLILPTVSVILGLATLMYFVPPRTVISQFFGGQPPIPLILACLVLSLLIYLNISRIGHSYCRWACPYGVLQGVIASPGALRIHYRGDRAEPGFCTECRACVDRCYMGINPMRGPQGACLNCGNCLAACDAAVKKTGGPRLLSFGFGEQGGGSFLRSVLDPRSLIALLVFILAVWVPIKGMIMPPADFSVTRHPTHHLLAQDGRTVANQFLVHISLEGGSPRTFELSIQGLPAVLEPDVITIIPGQDRTVPLRVRPEIALVPGTYPFRVLAVSQIDPGEVHRAEAVYFVPQ